MFQRHPVPARLPPGTGSSLWGQTRLETWILVQFPPLSGCVTLGKSHNPCRIHCLHL